jgi:hypothetical protein
MGAALHKRSRRVRTKRTPPEPTLRRGFVFQFLSDAAQQMIPALPGRETRIPERTRRWRESSKRGARRRERRGARSHPVCHRWRGGQLVRSGGAPHLKSAATRLVFRFAAFRGVPFRVVKDSIASSVNDGPSGHGRIRTFPRKPLPVFSRASQTLVVKISDTSLQEPAHLRAVELASRG